MADAAPEAALIARSPIAPAPPATVEQGWEISARRSSAALRIADATPLAKVLIKAPSDGAVARRLGVGFGRSARDAGGTLVVGSGPGEWLLLAPPGTAADVIRTVDDRGGRERDGGDRGAGDRDGDELVSAFDVTHGRALVRVSGAPAAAMLAKVCAVDLADSVTPDGAALRTSVAGVVTDVIRDDRHGTRSYLLHCERSSGQYLFYALLDAGGEFGIDIDGFVFPGV